MSDFKRLQRRRDERAARKEQAAEDQRWSFPQAVAALGDQDVGPAETWLDPDDPDVKRFLNTGMKSTAGKPQLLRPIVIEAVRRFLRDSGVTEPYEALLRDHPGVPSPVKVEGLFLGGILTAWANGSYWRTHAEDHLATLPPEIAVELGLVNKDGEPGVKYRTLQKQLVRLEDVIRAEDQKQGNGFDRDWLEITLIEATLPPDFCETVEAVAVDETAFESWFVQQCGESQKEVNKRVRSIYRERHGDVPAPEMSSPEMRAIAAEIGVPIGEDGRIIRTPLAPDARSGYRTPTKKQPDPYYIGDGVFFVHPTRTFTSARNKDEATQGDPIKAYVIAVTSRAANTDAGPVGLEMIKRAQDICPNIKDVHADQGFSRKASTFAAPLRRMGIDLHMGLPSDTTDTYKPMRFSQRDPNKSTLVKEFCGAFYHRFTPDYVFSLPFEERKHWMYRPNGSGKATGSRSFLCPFKTGHIYNRRLASFKTPNPNAVPVEVPDGVTDCCDGPCSFEASPEELVRFQLPYYGSQAHEDIRGLRNPVEGGFGAVKSQGGLTAESCRVASGEAHALAALFFAVSYNLQLTLNSEFETLRERQRANKGAKQTRKGDAAARKKKQNPKNLPHVVEPDSRDGMDGDDPADESDDESSVGTLTPPRAPP